jgi:predicted 2-oxoglutarate/Fe(II)-dependent dioxygenase YbiX
MTTLKEKWEGTDLPTIKAKETESELSILAEDNVSEKRWRSKYLSPHTTNNSWDLTLDEVGHQGHTHIFNVGKVFTKAYCREIIEEAEANGEWTNKRHDNYPTTDMLLGKFGADMAYENVLRKYVYPTVVENWRLEGPKWNKLKGENFIIKYNPGEQAGLALHHDFSEFTCLTTLNEEYEGGGTWFYNQKTLVKNKTGEMVFHPGTITHLHGGRPVTGGVRYIIVSFCRCDGDD